MKRKLAFASTAGAVRAAVASAAERDIGHGTKEVKQEKVLAVSTSRGRVVTSGNACRRDARL